MDNDFAIKVENLSKRYRIGLKEKKHDTFGSAFVSCIKFPFTNWRKLRKLSFFNENDGKDIIWALKDVSFEVKSGEVVGIIGPNGAGKSTLLKIISRITEPTSGEVIFNGKVSSLLEVGTGFHSELTGRENIYLNGTILGMSKSEIDRKFDEIVSFSGIEKFIDTPVKRFSSGMSVRLAFSVAAHLDPEILLIDEVLAVGDAKFQKKCIGKMNEVAKKGRTVLFVSHNMGAIRSLCGRGILLNNGLKFFDGQANDCIEKYFESLYDDSKIQNLSKDRLKIRKVKLKNARNEITNSFHPGDDLVIEILYHAPEKIEKPHFWVSVNGTTGSLFGANMIFDDTAPDYIEGDGTIRCVFKSIPLLPQEYFIRMGVRDSSTVNFLTQTKDVETLNVTAMMKDIGFKGEMADSLAGFSAPILVPYEWHLPDGEIVPFKMTKNKL